MRRCSVLLLIALLVGCAHSGGKAPKPGVSMQLELTSPGGQVVLSNGTAQSVTLYRSGLSLVASGKTERIPQFPKPLPPDKPVELAPGQSFTWQLVVSGRNLYPYSMDRGGIRLLEQEHRVRAVYQDQTMGRIKSDEVIYKID